MKSSNIKLITVYGYSEDRDSKSNPLGKMARFMASKYNVDADIYEWQDNFTLSAHYDKLIMVGYSFGGSRIIRQAKDNPLINVDLMVLLDPVPTDGLGFFNLKDFRLSKNVKNAICIWRKPWFMPPWSCPIRKAYNQHKNIVIKEKHTEYLDNQQIMDIVYDNVINTILGSK